MDEIKVRVYGMFSGMLREKRTDERPVGVYVSANSRKHVRGDVDIMQLGKPNESVRTFSKNRRKSLTRGHGSRAENE